MDERLLAEKLIGYDSSHGRGSGCAPVSSRAGSRRGTSRAAQLEVRGLPILIAEVGAEDGPTIVFHGHIDVVPGRAGQFEPRVDGDRLLGRGAYDMKGAARGDDAGRSPTSRRSGDVRVAAGDRPRRGGRGGDRPRDRRARRRRLRRRLRDHRRADRHADRDRRQGRARGADRGQRHAPRTARRPWEGDNAIIKAFDVFRTIESLPFSRRVLRAVRPAVDQPRPDLGRRRAQQGPGHAA